MDSKVEEVFDHSGKLIQVGATVSGGAGRPGEVTRITDWDGDMRDGRMIGYPPRVYVRWPEFDEEEDFLTGMRPDERTYCDDLEVIA